MRRLFAPWLAVGAACALMASCGAFGGEDTPAVDAGDKEGGATSLGCNSAGLCDCDGNAANGFETNVLASDTQNCGACARACVPDPVTSLAVCTAGVCTPAPVLASVPDANTVVAYGDDVYFGTNGENDGPKPGYVGRALAPTYTPEFPLTTQPHGVTSMAVNSTTLYVTFTYIDSDTAQLVSIPRSGPCAAGCPTVLVDGTQSTGGQTLVPTRVALTQNALVWLQRPDSNDPGQLVSAPLADPPDASPTVLDTSSEYADLVVNSTYAFASQYSAEIGVHAVPLAGCPAQKPQCVNDAFVATPVGSMAAAADDTALYWADASGDGGVATAIATRPNDGSSPPRAVVSGRAPIGAIAVDDRDLYWVEGATIYRIGKSGTCEGYAPCPEPMVVNATPLNGLALGTSMVFYTLGGQAGGVFRTPK